MGTMNITIPYYLALPILFAFYFYFFFYKLLSFAENWGGEETGCLVYFALLFIGMPLFFTASFIILGMLGIHIDFGSGGECVEYTWWGDCKKVYP